MCRNTIDCLWGDNIQQNYLFNSGFYSSIPNSSPGFLYCPRPPRISFLRRQERERRSPRMGGLVPCIAVSTFVIFLTIFLAEALRRIVAAFFPNGLVKNAVLEFVAAAEMCGCGFELIISKWYARAFEKPRAHVDLAAAATELKSWIVFSSFVLVADNYGVTAYSVYLFLLTIWWSDHWNDATACPYIHFESTIQGKMSALETVVRTVAQVAGGLIVFK